MNPASAFLLAVLVGVSLGGCQTDRQSAGTFRDGVSESGTHADRPSVTAARLDAEFSPAQTLGYGLARDALYAWGNGHGGVCGVYTDYCVTLGAGDPSKAAGRAGINAEHVWPQSKGARQEPLRSDLHHLFPERQTVNSSRGNLPFGEVTDRTADAWYTGDLSQSRTPDRALDDWTERGGGRWEPREDRKGDVARAVFYVAAVYPDQADPSFFAPMRETLLAWNRADPPDDAERDRSHWVAGLQGTENPFVLDPSLADQIWASGPISRPTGGARPPAAPPASRDADGGQDPGVRPTGALQITEIHYDNAGADTGEGIEISGPAGIALGGWALVLVNGADGAVYRTVPLTGTLAGEAVWVPVEGLQNGSPDGVALLDPSGRTVQALAWEGTFTAADGTRFRDLGASETASEPPGTSLQLVGGRWVAGRAASPGRANW